MDIELVWIVHEGEQGMGSSVRGVFRRLEDATAFVAKNYPQFIRSLDLANFVEYFDGGDWIRIWGHTIQ